MSKKEPNEMVEKYEKRLKKTETTRVYERDGYLVIKPLSPEACSLYGKKTKWCVSGKQLYRNWSNATAKNVCYYIVINKYLMIDDPLYKVLAEVSDNGEIDWRDVFDNKIEKPYFIE